jgi:quercetin dioxygenase-like cupin family protein
MLRAMTNLNHTQLLDPPDAASHAGEAIQASAAESPTTKPYFVEEGEARWYGNSLWEFLVPEQATGGQLAIFQATVPQGFSPPRHIHTREDEAFLILDGQVEFDLDGDHRLAGPGAAVYMPRGVAHTFRVKSPVARMLGVMTPGAFEQLFRNLSVPAGARTMPPPGTVPFEIPAVMAEQTRLGTRVVGPPMTGSDEP